MQPEPRIPAGLPEPDAASLAHSERVAEFIRGRISAAGGSIGFAEFMQLALYAPGLGYYAAGAAKFGGAGDFVTAPEISPLFGRVLAAQCARVLEAVGGGEILELGAGTGSLAVALLGKLAELGRLPQAYRILEVSPDLTERQQRRISREIPELAHLVSWTAALPGGFRGAIVANEVADALPVERFVRHADAVMQLRVAVQDGRFAWQVHPADDVLAANVFDIEGDIGAPLANGYVSEVSLGLKHWIGDILGALDEGVMFLFDYGVSRREYYAPQRAEGWLRCHFRHHAHSEPLLYPGIQDITAWVDFSAVADAALEHDADVAGFVTQALFLLNGGLQNELAGFETLPVRDQLELSRQIKLLTLPTEMGENFKCMGLARGVTSALDAFAMGDRTHTL